MRREIEILLAQSFSKEARVLAIGPIALDRAGVSSVPDLAGADGFPLPFEGAVWAVGDEFPEGVSRLRRLLEPGASLVLVSQRRGGPLSFLGRRAAGPSPQELAAGACEVLLCAGLCGPQVLLSTSTSFAASATLPEAISPLDVFF